ncbi:MAG: SLBB domain-containing protein [Alphaproteobacteria bacterium]|nr:SLBB domain-containing protein [Alphaproteobacteria bacterium]
MLAKLDEAADNQRKKHKSYKCQILICNSTSCRSSEGKEVIEALGECVKSHELTEIVEIIPTGCMGLCAKGPLVRVELAGKNPVIYKHVNPMLARLILAQHVMMALKHKGDFQLPDFLKEHTLPIDMPFFAKQTKIALDNVGIINPDSIEDYLSRGGYESFRKVLTMTPSEVIDEIKKSGLRGRGGGGFPTGLKWDFANKSEGDEKFIICNGDEGDPGAYMDSGLLEGDPHAVLEGMMIGAYAQKATTGWFYIRAEYPLAVERLTKAIKHARKYRLLGKDILGSGFDFNCEVRLGAGAFVCGEETALIASIEGKRGTPRPRPPYPTESGLWGKPSSINNVETFANIPKIIRMGADKYYAIGSDKSKGTKVFALTGRVENGGLVEVPMGMSIKEIVSDIGGGVADGKQLKAVQTGGPSGGVIPTYLHDLPVCYDKLKEVGSIMGSGGMIVMDNDDSMVEIAKFYLGFTVEESCGKCSPCRIGGTQMLRILERISEGKGKKEDIDKLKRLSFAMQKASLCGLGQTSPNPVLSTLKFFEEEYMEKMTEEANDEEVK